MFSCYLICNYYFVSFQKYIQPVGYLVFLHIEKNIPWLLQYSYIVLFRLSLNLVIVIVCSKEWDKNNYFYTMYVVDWTGCYWLHHHILQHIFSFFSLINIQHMERINKAILFVNLLFFVPKKEEIYKNRLRLGVAVLFLEYTFVFR